jgi:hypothetical protein
MATYRQSSEGRHSKIFFSGNKKLITFIVFLQQEVDSCGSSFASARLLTLLRNGDIG